MSSSAINIFIRKNFHYILLIVVFLAFCLTRFSNLSERIAFGWDQEQFSIQIRKIIVNHKPTLIGARVNNDLGFFLGPYFPYLLIPLFLLSGLHPIALTYFILVENILFFALAFLVVKKLFSRYHALAFLALWTINPIAQFYDVVPWSVIFVVVGVFVIFLLFFYLWKNPKKWFLWFLLGTASGFFFNMHFQFVFIFIFTNILVFFFFREKKLSFRNLVIYLASFLATFLPLLVFDLRHGFLNSRLFLNFFLKGTDAVPKDYFSFVPVLVNFFQPFTIVKSTVLAFAFNLFIFAACVILTIKNKKKKFFRYFYTATAVIWIMTPFVFSFYGKRPSEYYFLYLLPFIFIVLTDLFISFKKEIALIVVIFLLAVFNFNFLRDNLKSDYTGLYYKDRVAQYLRDNLKGKRFNVSFYGVSIDNGFPYLFDYYAVTPSGDPKDPLVEVGYPAREQASIEIGHFGLIIPPSLSN